MPWFSFKASYLLLIYSNSNITNHSWRHVWPFLGPESVPGTHWAQSLQLSREWRVFIWWQWSPHESQKPHCPSLKHRVQFVPRIVQSTATTDWVLIKIITTTTDIFKHDDIVSILCFCCKIDKKNRIINYIFCCIILEGDQQKTFQLINKWLWNNDKMNWRSWIHNNANQKK